jgi:hypothetical protein
MLKFRFDRFVLPGGGWNVVQAVGLVFYDRVHPDGDVDAAGSGRGSSSRCLFIIEWCGEPGHLTGHLLNADGTLRLDGDLSGALDLSGWDVRLDPDRGPLFTSSAREQTPSMNAPASGHWGDLGGGGPALNGAVYAMVMIGGFLYAGGAFTDADNIPEADYLARWDGSSWSAVGGDGFGNGTLNGWVLALATDGTNLYAGGEFGNIMNNGVTLSAADYIAKWDGLGNWSAWAQARQAMARSTAQSIPWL